MTTSPVLQRPSGASTACTGECRYLMHTARIHYQRESARARERQREREGGIDEKREGERDDRERGSEGAREHRLIRQARRLQNPVAPH